jgi:hypothetical protein
LKTWQEIDLSNSGIKPEPRRDHTLTLWNNNLVVFGGKGKVGTLPSKLFLLPTGNV